MFPGASKPWGCDGVSLAKAYPGTAKCFLMVLKLTDGPVKCFGRFQALQLSWRQPCRGLPGTTKCFLHVSSGFRRWQVEISRASKPWSYDGGGLAKAYRGLPCTAKCFLLGVETDGWTLEMLPCASKPCSCDGGSLAKAYPGRTLAQSVFLWVPKLTDGPLKCRKGGSAAPGASPFYKLIKAESEASERNILGTTQHHVPVTVAVLGFRKQRNSCFCCPSCKHPWLTRLISGTEHFTRSTPRGTLAPRAAYLHPTPFLSHVNANHSLGWILPLHDLAACDHLTILYHPVVKRRRAWSVSTRLYETQACLVIGAFQPQDPSVGN